MLFIIFELIRAYVISICGPSGYLEVVILGQLVEDEELVEAGWEGYKVLIILVGMDVSIFHLENWNNIRNIFNMNVHIDIFLLVDLYLLYIFSKELNF